MAKQDLTLVGLTDDGNALVLVSDTGEEFTVAVDAKLRSALRGDATPHQGETSTGQQLEISMESALRPRDIQARIRAGESPENVAAAAQTSVEKVMVFAMPVLAERAHVAERAQRASVRRRTGEGPGGVLRDAVAERLRSRNVDPESVEWDAWRREDGRWSLTASYSAGESARNAAFVYDAAGRYVVAEDDESRWLVGERVRAQPVPGAADDVAATPALRRLSSVTSDDDPLELGDDALELVRARTEDLTETARTLRSVPEQLPISGDRADADWMVTQATERPVVRDRQPEPEPALESESDEQEQERNRPAKKGKGRASVPSWDEIMFGSGRE